MQEERLKYLFDRYRTRTCTPEERQELAVLCLLPENQAVVEKLVEDTWEQIPLEKDMPADKGASLLQKILHQSFQQSAPEPATVKQMGRRRWAAAASVLLIVGLGGYLFFSDKAGKLTHETASTQPVHMDVEAPKLTKATITLADGNMVSLDSLQQGLLAEQGNTKLVKLADDQIAYQSSTGEIVKEIQYNTLFNPRGSKVIDMQLSDGSHVWLNAGSSVTYPVAFAGNERRVSITGEAYFEVAHKAVQPFKVSKGETEITVLGTHFNVNAYDDEEAIRVTLLEGSVKISRGAENIVIIPGQQAEIHHSSLILHHSVNTDAVMAWKNGLFAFNGADIKEVMRQLARWYDLEVSYAGDIPSRRFKGKISKDLSLSQVLNGLTATRVYFKLEGSNKLTVLPEPRR